MKRTPNEFNDPIDNDLSQGARMFYFIFYTVLYEGLIWGLVAAAIFYLQWSEWTVLVGIIMSASQFQPRSFGLKTFSKDPMQLDDEDFVKWKKVQANYRKNKEVNNERI